MKWQRSIPRQRFTGKFKRPRGQARGDLDLLRGARRLRLMF